MARVTVVGATAWGLTLAHLFARAGNHVCLLTRDPTEALTVRLHRTAPERIASIRLPDSVDVTPDPVAGFADAWVAVFVVPSQTLRRNAGRVAEAFPPGCIAVSAAKGVEQGSGQRMSQVLAETLTPGTPVCALSGPNLAEEIARGLPAATVVAGDDAATRTVQAALNSAQFRVYTSTDVVGVELGGALKNIIALAAGINDGLGYGDNAKASLITRGLAEIARLGAVMGAQPLTFSGLSGLGDVIATCASPLSRNRHVGEELGRGRALSDILADLHHVAEGVATTFAAHALAADLGVEMPIVAGMAAILRGDLSPADGARRLMERSPRAEC